jgi:pimeloyl-ACP methyl ester carboxylesterase
MATFVLIHGAWHGGWCWKRVTPLLRAAGHEVYAPTLTGLGESIRRAPVAGWRFRVLPTGHDAMITMPRELANLFLEVVESERDRDPQ